MPSVEKLTISVPAGRVAPGATLVIAITLLLIATSARSARAGELDLALGVTGTTTAWPDDHGGGSELRAVWWFRDWIGGSFVGKEQYAQVDQRFMSYFSLNAAARHTFGPVRLEGNAGLVHQHEEPYAAVMDQPLGSLFGVGDGIRHRMALRAGTQLALPFTTHAHGDWYVAVDLDITRFMDDDRGPPWMTSIGLGVGFTYDFARSSK